MVNLLLACSAAVAGALIGSVSGDLIINKKIAVDTSEGVENAKVVEIPKRPPIQEKKNDKEKQKNQNLEKNKVKPQDQNNELTIEKVEGEIIEPSTEPIAESKSVDKNTVKQQVTEQQIDETKAAEGESQNQCLGSPSDPNIVLNTNETQPAQFTPIDKQ